MKKSIFALFSICVIAISCGKDDPDPVSPIATKPYSNTNDGSNWIYDVRTLNTTTSATDTTYDTSRVVAGDTLINAKTYKKIDHYNGASRSYTNVTGNDYYQFQSVALLDTSIEALYLKDNANVGDNWQQDLTVDPGLGVPIPFTLKYTILEKGVSRTVYGITYNDVISVKTEVTSSALPGAITSDIRNYYARDIGLIESYYDIVVTSPVATHVHNETFLKFSDPH
jgi:hypothetical protein